MKIEVTYKVNAPHFAAVCDSIAEAYECVKAIVKRESAAFPNTEETLSEYIVVLANIDSRITISHENHLFKIFRLEEDSK